MNGLETRINKCRRIIFWQLVSAGVTFLMNVALNNGWQGILYLLGIITGVIVSMHLIRLWVLDGSIYGIIHRIFNE